MSTCSFYFKGLSLEKFYFFLSLFATATCSLISSDSVVTLISSHDNQSQNVNLANYFKPVKDSANSRSGHWDQWDPDTEEPFISIPAYDCDVEDAVNQTKYAELIYLHMEPPCETIESEPTYCTIRRRTNITLASKFRTKSYNKEFRVRVHLVDKNFGFETAVWPEFGACRNLFKITCPQEAGVVHSIVRSELPPEVPPISLILRVRLISVNEANEKNVAICRQIKLNIV